MGNKHKFIYEDLTGQIIDLAKKIYKNLGYGLPEKIYQRALDVELKNRDLNFIRESYCRIEYKGKFIGKFFLDFFVEDKVAVELKVRNELYEGDCIQLLNYLKAKNLKVGLLIVFTSFGVKLKRIVN